VALLAQLDRGRPLVKLSKESGFNLLELSLNPPLVIVSQHSSDYKGKRLDTAPPNCSCDYPSQQFEIGRRGEGSPFSFQQLTSTQSPISPINPVFPPFVGIKVRNSFPSNNITSYNHPGKVYQPGSIPWESHRQWVLWVRISGKPRQAFRRVFPKTEHPRPKT
jgi:hypothetical protein